jgi:hypothetical protein
VIVERTIDLVTTALLVGRPDRLTAVLARPDLTLLRGAPLALVSEHYGIVGVATGPKELVEQLRVLSDLSRLEDGETVEIPAVADTQPSLQLLAARPAY